MPFLQNILFDAIVKNTWNQELIDFECLVALDQTRWHDGCMNTHHFLSLSSSVTLIDSLMTFTLRTVTGCFRKVT